MVSGNPISLSEANQAFFDGDLERAVASYVKLICDYSEIAETILPSLQRASLALTKRRKSSLAARINCPRVGIMGWDMAHNAAGRVYTLAQLYNAESSPVIMGCLFPGSEKVWEPLRQLEPQLELLKLSQLDQFFVQAIRYVADHPVDLLHLSKPRASNILFGLLYKLIWGAFVVIDVDDEELEFVGATHSLSIEEVVREFRHLPSLNSLNAKTWTQISVGLISAFDGITTASHPLQERYGGQLIPHVRDESIFRPSIDFSIESRIRYGIHPDEKVVIFLGTPKLHKGLIEIAYAIAALNDRRILFLIVGEFADPSLRAALMQIGGVTYRFMSNVPLSEVPAIVSTADVCALMQYEDLLAARYQCPAKLTDVLAMGIPVICTRTEGLAHVISMGVATPARLETLALQLRDILDNRDGKPRICRKSRRYFERYLSVLANRPKARRLIADAINTRTSRRPLAGSLKTLVSTLNDPRLSLLAQAVIKNVASVGPVTKIR